MKSGGPKTTLSKEERAEKRLQFLQELQSQINELRKDNHDLNHLNNLLIAEQNSSDALKNVSDDLLKTRRCLAETMRQHRNVNRKWVQVLNEHITLRSNNEALHAKVEELSLLLSKKETIELRDSYLPPNLSPLSPEFSTQLIKICNELQQVINNSHTLELSLSIEKKKNAELQLALEKSSCGELCQLKNEGSVEKVVELLATVRMLNEQVEALTRRNAALEELNHQMKECPPSSVGLLLLPRESEVFSISSTGSQPPSAGSQGGEAFTPVEEGEEKGGEERGEERGVERGVERERSEERGEAKSGGKKKRESPWKMASRRQEEAGEERRREKREESRGDEERREKERRGEEKREEKRGDLEERRGDIEERRGEERKEEETSAVIRRQMEKSSQPKTSPANSPSYSQLMSSIPFEVFDSAMVDFTCIYPSNQSEEKVEGREEKRGEIGEIGERDIVEENFGKIRKEPRDRRGESISTDEGKREKKGERRIWESSAYNTSPLLNKGGRLGMSERLGRLSGVFGKKNEEREGENSVLPGLVGVAIGEERGEEREKVERRGVRERSRSRMSDRDRSVSRGTGEAKGRSVPSPGVGGGKDLNEVLVVKGVVKQKMPSNEVEEKEGDVRWIDSWMEKQRSKMNALRADDGAKEDGEKDGDVSRGKDYVSTVGSSTVVNGRRLSVGL